jgi:hypothetical protein
MLGPLEKTSIQSFVVIFGRALAPQPLWTRRSSYELVTFVDAGEEESYVEVPRLRAF